MINPFQINSTLANTQTARDCLIYLALEDMKTVVVATHLNSIGDSDEVWIEFKRIVDSDPNILLYIDTGNVYLAFNPPVFVTYRHWVQFLIQRLVESGEDINRTDENGDSILHVAESLNSPDINFFLKLRADINGRNRFGQSILHRKAREGGPLDVIAWLQKHGVNLNAQADDGTTALHSIVLWDWRTLGTFFSTRS
jgi:ankyrin repeat protein